MAIVFSTVKYFPQVFLLYYAAPLLIYLLLSYWWFLSKCYVLHIVTWKLFVDFFGSFFNDYNYCHCNYLFIVVAFHYFSVVVIFCFETVFCVQIVAMDRTSTLEERSVQMTACKMPYCYIDAHSCQYHRLDTSPAKPAKPVNLTHSDNVREM